LMDTPGFWGEINRQAVYYPLIHRSDLIEEDAKTEATIDAFLKEQLQSGESAAWLKGKVDQWYAENNRLYRDSDFRRNLLSEWDKSGNPELSEIAQKAGYRPVKTVPNTLKPPLERPDLPEAKAPSNNSPSTEKQVSDRQSRDSNVLPWMVLVLAILAVGTCSIILKLKRKQRP